MPNLRLASARPSAPLVISVIALFVSLAGTGVAAGVLPANSVSTFNIKDKAVSATKLRGNAVSSTTVANRSLGAVDFQRSVLGAYAQVTGGATPTFTAATSNFSAITRTAVGTYCLTPAAGISSATHPAVVSAEPEGPTFAVGLATVASDGCATGQYQVVTYRIFVEAMGGPQPSDDVQFSIIVS